MIYNNIYKVITIVMLLVFMSSCDDGGSEEEEMQLEKPTPTKAVGTLPANGEPCSDFEIIPNDDSKVSISFKWTSAQNTTNYDLIVLEGTSEVSNTTVDALQTNVTLSRGKTYTWRVVSKNENNSSISDTYSFTTPGLAASNYAPYSAEITVIFDTTAKLFNMKWTAVDEDGDDLVFDISISDEQNIIVEENDTSNLFINGTPYTGNTVYNFKVTAKDANGNFSISETSIISPE
jgi:hypothetical protein